jgi:hypothetical protein
MLGAERRKGKGTDRDDEHWADGEDDKKEVVSLPCAALGVLMLMLLATGATVYASTTEAERERHLDVFQRYAVSTGDTVVSKVVETHAYLNAPLEDESLLPSNGGNAARTAKYATMSLFQGHAPYLREHDER